MKYLLSSLLAGLAVASKVNVLTTDTFDEFVNSHPLVLAEFYAPWCGHCKALAPEYDNASEVLAENEDHDVALAKVDCTENEELCSSLEIRGYPTLFVFKGRDKYTPYTGGRKSELIVSYMLKQALPAVTPVDSKSLDSFKALDDVTVLAFVDNKADNTTFTDVAETLRDKYVFGVSDDADLKKKLGVTSTPSLVLFKNYDDPETIYDKEFTAEGIASFIKAESFPLIGEIGPNTYGDYHQSGIPLLYVFVDKDDDRKALDKILKPLAIKHKGAVNFGMIDAAAYGAHAPNVNLQEGQWPAIAIENFKTSQKFPHDQAIEITAESAAEFVDSFVDGSLKPTLKSAPVPEEQPDAVYTLVGSTFQELVVDSDKDVLVEFYAPWCGHCKNLAPTWEELAQLYKGAHDDKVMVAKIDHTANEVPGLEISGYPTIKLFPAGSKVPVDYQGARTLDAFVEFIKTNGKYAVDGNAKEAAKEPSSKGGKAKKAKKTKKAKKDKKAKKTDVKEEL